jgi:hypothetical protein
MDRPGDTMAASAQGTRNFVISLSRYMKLDTGNFGFNAGHRRRHLFANNLPMTERNILNSRRSTCSTGKATANNLRYH